jgi:cytochrome c biogenesis protein CcmG/thiol:disulfide interchange protein DsbE
LFVNGRFLKWAGMAVALATVVLAVVLASRFGTDPGLVNSPLIGQPAPAFQLETLDQDGTVQLGDLNGQIVVINFFASWCLECRSEHADFVAASNAFGPDGVAFVQIGYQEAIENSLKYLDEAGRSEWTTYVADPGSRTAIAYGVFGIPETFFVDETGVVVGKIIGETDALMLGATIDAIKRGETPGQAVTGDTQQAPDS